MLISERMAKALSDHLANEYWAAIQYTMISSYFSREALPQLAGLFRTQVAEELMHAQKIVDYVTEAGGFLQWFVDEQLEEVSTMDDLLKVVRRAGDNLLYVEDYVATRPPPVVAPPA